MNRDPLVRVSRRSLLRGIDDRLPYAWMTVADLGCDVCGRMLTGSVVSTPDAAGSAVRLYIHPGDASIRDDRVLICRGCWSRLLERFGPPDREGVCCVCEAPVDYDESLHLIEMTGRIGEAPSRQLCREHSVEFLNGLRITEPKLTPETLALKRDFTAR